MRVKIEGNVRVITKTMTLYGSHLEYNIATGMEYDFAKQFAIRLGYFHEHYTKGNRQFITFGAGLHYQVLTIDMSYLVSTTQQNPLANTLRFSLRFSVGGNAKVSEPVE
jgi:hypothetical protein